MRHTRIADEDLERFVLISVGGADGGEACHFLGNTTCRNAILLEYSSVASKSAKHKDYYLEKALKKRLYTIQGDAGETIGLAVAMARKILAEIVDQSSNKKPYGIIWSF